MLFTIAKEVLRLRTLLKKKIDPPKTKMEADRLLEHLRETYQLIPLYKRVYELLTGETSSPKWKPPSNGYSTSLLKDLNIGNVIKARFSEKRRRLFSENQTCVTCGIVGILLCRVKNPQNNNHSVSLYGVKNGKLVLMTLDHIKPKSKGGSDLIENLQVMCEDCNFLKDNLY